MGPHGQTAQPSSLRLLFYYSAAGFTPALEGPGKILGFASSP